MCVGQIDDKQLFLGIFSQHCGGQPLVTRNAKARAMWRGAGAGQEGIIDALEKVRHVANARF